MKRKRKTSKGEGILLCLTALFLCVLLGLYHRDLKAAPLSIETERGGRQEAPPELPAPEPAAAEPLDLNRASVEELTGLPGIGTVLAERIVAYREAHGPFASVEELLRVSGIGEKKLASLEGLIQVSGG